VLLTPHTAGETRHYEDNVDEILRDNLDASGAAKSHCATRWSEGRAGALIFGARQPGLGIQ